MRPNIMTKKNEKKTNKNCTYSIINYNGILAKNEIRQLLPKYKNGNDIHEHKMNHTNVFLTCRIDQTSNKL